MLNLYLNDYCYYSGAKVTEIYCVVDDSCKEFVLLLWIIAEFMNLQSSSSLERGYDNNILDYIFIVKTSFYKFDDHSLIRKPKELSPLTKAEQVFFSFRLFFVPLHYSSSESHFEHFRYQSQKNSGSYL